MSGNAKAKKKSTAKYHTVKSGDTVSGLAVKYGSTQKQIVSWNKLASADKIYIGQKVKSEVKKQNGINENSKVYHKSLFYITTKFNKAPRPESLQEEGLFFCLHTKYKLNENDEPVKERTVGEVIKRNEEMNKLNIG